MTLRRTRIWRFSGTNCSEIGIIIALSFACWPAEMFLSSVSPASVGQNSGFDRKRPIRSVTEKIVVFEICGWFLKGY